MLMKKLPVGSSGMLNTACDLQGWWDQHWIGCPNLDTVQNETTYIDSIDKQLALHTRYPGHGNHTGPQDSQLQRTLQLIDNVFDQCPTRDCIQHHSVPLVDYLYYDDFHTHQHQRRSHAHGDTSAPEVN